jgi:hypothetical protein
MKSASQSWRCAELGGQAPARRHFRLCIRALCAGGITSCPGASLAHPRGHLKLLSVESRVIPDLHSLSATGVRKRHRERKHDHSAAFTDHVHQLILPLATRELGSEFYPSLLCTAVSPVSPHAHMVSCRCKWVPCSLGQRCRTHAWW